MKNFKTLMFSLIALAILAGCSTIEFTNGNAAASQNEAYGYWHHNVAYSLYELSEPVNLDNCQNGEWSSLMVEKDIVAALAGSIDWVVLVDAWDPWTVDLTC